MDKDFDSWNSVKKRIHKDNPHRVYRERQVWWISLGTNIGTEEDGKGEHNARPAVIVKGFDIDTCLTVPLTTAPGMFPYCLHVGTINGQEAFALPYQIRCVDTKRFKNRIGLMEVTPYKKLKSILRSFF